MLDFIAIGLGPFNLSLAALLQSKTTLNYCFFESKPQFEWHAGMQLPHSVLQVPFMADLVSMVDPTSAFSFLNYLKNQQRLYQFYFLEQAHIPRQEYNHYCQWVAQQLENIQYQSQVIDIVPLQQGYRVHVQHQHHITNYDCRKLVIGSGQRAALPPCLNDLKLQHPQQCIHSSDYLHAQPETFLGDVALLGSGQSAAEIFQHLLLRQDQLQQQNQLYQNQQSDLPSPPSDALQQPHATQTVTDTKLQLHWFTRGKGFLPMEYTPLALEHFSPDYVKHFYHLDSAQKTQQLQSQALLYKGMSAQSIRQIYQALYHRSIAQRPLNAHLHSQCELLAAEQLANRKIRLFFQQNSMQQDFYIDVDYVVAATGYQPHVQAYMQHLQPLILRDDAQRYQVSFDYRLQHQAYGDIFVQNQDIFTHGVGTPDLGLGAYRAAVIANQLAQSKLYDVDTSATQTFQHFDVVQNPEIHLSANNLSSLLSHQHASTPTPSASSAQSAKLDIVAKADSAVAVNLAPTIAASSSQHDLSKTASRKQVSTNSNRHLQQYYEKSL